MRDGHSLFGQEAVMGCALVNRKGGHACSVHKGTVRSLLLADLDRCVSHGSDVWKHMQGVGVVVTGAGSWESRYQVADFMR